MSLRDVIQNATKQPLAFVARELGDQLSVAREVKVRRRDNSTTSQLTGITGLVHVQGTLEEVDAVLAQKTFGADTTSTGVVSVQTTVEIMQGDVVAVESGAFEGRQWTVEDRRFDQMTNSWTLGVREVPPAAIAGL